jgi:cytochrome c oxidase subunit 3
MILLNNKKLNEILLKNKTIGFIKHYSNGKLAYLKTKHSWHLVDPSPWPFVTSIVVFIFFTGNVMYMHRYTGGAGLALGGLFGILVVMYMWWRDIVREATFEEQHTYSVQRGLRLGMVLFIISEIMFFFFIFLGFFSL